MSLMVERALERKVAIVTGAATGIGKAAALLFARHGARVMVSDIDIERGQETTRTIRDEGGESSFFKADVSASTEVEALVEHTVQNFGKLDCAFNNAGIEGQPAPTHESSEANWERVIAVNLKSTWLCMKFELLPMLQQGSGSIVNMSSVAGLVGFPGLPAYVASKHGVVGLTRTAALEYAQQGIRINAVCPGVIRTEMIDRLTGKKSESEEEFIAYEPLGRMGTADEVAEAALWLCTDAASFVTGHALTVDGGFVAR